MKLAEMQSHVYGNHRTVSFAYVVMLCRLCSAETLATGFDTSGLGRLKASHLLLR